MTSVQERFQAAVNVIKGLPKNGPYQPSNSMMLKFYGLYKQATEGPCNHGKPAFWDVVSRAKWEAWYRNNHLTKEEAMQKYVQHLQEIIETMSFTENVQNFVGSLQGLENINLDELEIVAPGMRELAESHPSSPFHSRTNSPQHSTNDDGENLNLNGHDSSLTTTPTYGQNIELPSQLLDSSETTTRNFSKSNGLSQSDQSDDEYVDPFDFQNELCESLQRNTDVLNQVQATVSRMNSDISSVNQRILHLERILREIKNTVTQHKSRETPATHKYVKWWPFSDISPVWFLLLVLWPFIARRIGTIMRNSPKHH